MRPRLPSDNWLTRFFRALFSFFAVAAALASLCALAGGLQLLLVQPVRGPGVWLPAVFFFAISIGLASVAAQQWIMGRPHNAGMLRPWRRVWWYSMAVAGIAFVLSWTITWVRQAS